jgi:hypothetical protein
MKTFCHKLLVGPFLLLFFLSTAAFANPAWPSNWFDRSHQIFFPPALQESVSVSQSFPVFWWNFVIFDLKDDARDWPKAEELCARLKALPHEILLRAECDPKLDELQDFAVDWAQDLPLRSNRPDDKLIREKLDSALAKASLPTGDRSLMKLLQADPLESWQDLKKLVDGRLKINLERKQGFFFDQASHRVVIPVQAAFGPSETWKTREFLKDVGDYGDQVSLIGPHASTLRNQDQVARDLNSVSKAAYIILALFGGILLFLRRWKLLLLFPPVFVAVGSAAVATVLVFGSIHGLTLSFGVGIIGLVLDYGFNGALNDKSDQKKTWKSNFVGVITTLAGLFILMMSTIPLLRQMMFFSAVGLMIGFALFYGLMRRYPRFFLSQATGVSFSPSTTKSAVVFCLLAISVSSLFVLHPNLDMKQFDFQDRHAKATTDWLYKTLDFRPPLFSVNQGPDALEAAHRERDWADKNKIAVESIANYLPRGQEQKSHLQTWMARKCDDSTRGFDSTQRVFFGAFIKNVLCSSAQPRLAEADLVRSYTWHLNSGDRWISLWMPTSEQQETLVRESHFSAHSLREVVLAFPETLAHELSWMAPSSFLLVLLILFAYYRRVAPSLIALIPFFSGLGLFTLFALTFKLQVSFITVIGLVMCFGFSFDYAIFAVDCYAFGGRSTSNGVWEAISTAACATLAGFIPLLFCEHPVLKHLGQSLCLSTIGCYFGAVWGVPGLMKLIKTPRQTS